MRLAPLHDRFGVEVLDVDVRQVRTGTRFARIRAAFEAHSLLLFRNQDLNDAEHLRFGALFGPVEDRSMGANGPDARMDNVTNRLADGTVAAADSLHTLNLTGNQLWHTDSTFLPVPALANLLAARVLPSEGGETELVSTRVAWAEMPPDLKSRTEGVVFRHRLAHSRSRVSKELAGRPEMNRWDDQIWRSLWRNPVNGTDSLYIASHACGVEGMAPEAGLVLIDELIDFATRPSMVYSHAWQPGDLLVWDERATLHRGRPWPYAQERTLASICISAGARDGLASVTPWAGPSPRPHDGQSQAHRFPDPRR